MFATDIDLLVIEPSLFAEVGWSGQRTVAAAGTLSGTTLTLASADLVAAGVEAGCVVLMNGVPLEVVSRTSATVLSVSLVRWGRTGPAIPPVGLTSGACEVYTFRPQTALAHRVVLRLLGLSEATPVPTVSGSDGTALGESAMVNSADAAMFEALVALHTIYASAGALAPAGSGLATKAEQYRRRAGAERARLSALIDTNGDGLADATRRPGVMPLIRG
ncbi:MAG: hypothetical protein Q8L55_15970 [Phycisphaerales bacterium]|nr:hypothetical protein [Phycisphaerales bacterium]